MTAVHEQDVVLLVGGDRGGEVVLDPQVDDRAEALVHRRGLALDLRAALGVDGDVLARRGEQREHPDPAAQLGVRVEQPRERVEAAHDVLGRIRAVDANHEELGPLGHERALGLEHGLALGERRRTPADRPTPDESAPGPDRPRLSYSAHERRKCSRQRAVWNVTTSFASRPSWISRTISGGSACQASGSGQGMWTKCESAASGTSLANEPRSEIQVVVVEEHGRVGPAVELLADRVREGAVHGRVGVPRGNVDRIGQLGQRVLDEPQRRIRDDVVEAVVDLGVVRNEAKAAAFGLERPSRRRRAVLLGQGARNPGDVVAVEQAGEHRDETAGAAPGDPMSVLVAGKLDRPPVRDDDQRTARAHAPKVRRRLFRARGPGRSRGRPGG